MESATADESPVVMDLGPGTLGKLQRYGHPENCHVVFSHLHADHCLDFPSLLVWRRFHPERASHGIHQLRGPSYTVSHLGRLSSDDQPGGIDPLTDTFAFQSWEGGKPTRLGGLDITPYPAVHPVESYVMRVEDPVAGTALAYSGDTAWTPQLVTAARDVDVLICEANWAGHTEDNPPGMHLSGAEAGRAARLAGARRLVVVHIPPWINPQDAVRAARTEYDGPIELGLPGNLYELPGAAR